MTKRGVGVGVGVLLLGLGIAAAWVLGPTNRSVADPCLVTGLPSTAAGDRPVDWIEFLTRAEFGGRRAGSEGAHQVGIALLSRLRSLGLTSPAGGMCQSFPLFDGLVFNLVADLPPTRTAEIRLVLGAHYDGQGMHPTRGPLPGADDNASGVAAILEVARRLAADPPHHVSVRFVLFTAEEVGRRGSAAWIARRPEAASTEPRFTAAMILDMVGRPLPPQTTVTGDAPRFAIRSDDGDLWTHLRHAATESGLSLVPVSDLGNRAPGASDDEPLRNAGLAVGLLTSGLHEDYHEPGDLAERVDLDQVVRAAKLMEAWVKSYDHADKDRSPGATNPSQGYTPPS